MTDWRHMLIAAARAVWHGLEPFVPGVLGALVAQATKPGLGWRQRLIQWSVSLVVYHFVSLALTSLFHWPQAVGNAVGFFVAFLAFEALHAWQKAAIEAGVGVFAAIPGMVASWGKRPGAAAVEPTEGEG